MRPVTIPVVVAAALAACAALLADEEKKPDEEKFHAERLHRPQDTAPPKQIIVPRPPSDYRPKGSLLATAHHQPRRVDTAELHRRKLNLYAGHIVTHSLPGPGRPVSPVAVTRTPRVETREGPNFAVITYWSFIAVAAFVTLWLLAKAFQQKFLRGGLDETTRPRGPKHHTPPRDR